MHRCCRHTFLLPVLLLSSACQPPDMPPCADIDAAGIYVDQWSNTSVDGDSERRFKVEWGGAIDGEIRWEGALNLLDAELLEAQPYLLETGDSLDLETLELSTASDDLYSDGALLLLDVGAYGELEIDTNHGTDHVSLTDLEVDQARLVYFRWGRYYVEVSRITEQEWETALSYHNGDRPTERFDALPWPGYQAKLVNGRAHSELGQATIEEEALQFYQNDAFFRNAEDLRRAVNQQLYVVAPSVLAVGEDFDITVLAFDINGHLVEDFAAAIDLSLVAAPSSQAEAPAIVDIPPRITLTSGHSSLATLPKGGLALQPGLVLLKATDPSGRFAPGTIPIRVAQDPSERIFWGDLHTHSNLSDGDFEDICPEDVYRYGRDIGRLDFQALSDHDYRRPIPDWKWPVELAAARDFYDPGRFVTLVAYEWSAEDIRFSEVIGHKNVYFRTADPPVYSAWDPRFNTPEKLWAALRAYPGVGNAITIPHHPVRPINQSASKPLIGGPGTNWNYHDEELQPLVEIYSRWGLSEFNTGDNPRPVKSSRGTGSAQYALGLGYRLGFMSSSDTHDGSPGVSVLPYRRGVNPYPIGTVAVFAPELTREQVFDALLERRCYGASGGRRPILELTTATGLRAGQVATVSGPPTLEFSAAGTTTIRSLTLLRIKGTEVETLWSGGGESWVLEGAYTDESLTANDGEVAYYVKLVQGDDEMAWIGPLFISLTGPGGKSAGAAER